MSGTSVSRVAYYLALVGGILMIILGLLGLADSSIRGLHFYWEYAYGGIVTLICGVIAIIGAKSANTLVWSIVLIIVGIVGGGLGGLLVLLGGVFGLVTVLDKSR
jgi:hypothetical protein